MKPQEILLRNIDRHVKPQLESLDFRCSRSKVAFSRKSGIATQEVAFSLDRHNSDRDCSFWTTWSCRAPSYSKWHEQQYGKPPANDVLGAASEWNIPKWSRKGHEHATLRNDKGDIEVIRRLIDDITQAGVPWLNSISTWISAANRLVAENWFFAKASDFFILAGENHRALAAVAVGIRRYTVEGLIDQMGEMPELQLRRSKHFPQLELGTTLGRG
ncbi:MAG: hypothetical protein K1X57_14780 [Gemmataceae bacterium]|nr:hypothetical protein [Gemmataceae bacterium]